MTASYSSFSDVRARLTDILKAALSDRSSVLYRLLVSYDNQGFAVTDITAPYLRFSVRNGDSLQQTIGPVGRRVFERDGYIRGVIYSPIETVNTVMDGIASCLIGDVFPPGRVSIASDSASNLILLPGTYNEQEIGDEKYFEGEVNINFIFDEIR